MFSNFSSDSQGMLRKGGWGAFGFRTCLYLHKWKDANMSGESTMEIKREIITDMDAPMNFNAILVKIYSYQQKRGHLYTALTIPVKSFMNLNP